jgi:hypothetical protein
MMAPDQQVSDEIGDHANSEGNEREASDLNDEMEAEIEVEPGSEDEIEQQRRQDTENSEAGDMLDFLG